MQNGLSFLVGQGQEGGTTVGTRFTILGSLQIKSLTIRQIVASFCRMAISYYYNVMYT